MDRYIKGATLGEGTFGVVFQATHKEVGDPLYNGMQQQCSIFR